ncbi:MAG: NmrA family NAD(P)-binding protein [Anaerolineales bacterium]
MILVTGAAGKTGLALLCALKQRGATVRALIRRQERETEVLEAGARQAQLGDLLDAGSLSAAFADVGAVYLICPNVHPREFEMARNAITVAKQAGVRRIVYHSVLYPQIEAMPHHWQKLKVEEALIQSGLEFTILQPASYMQNILPYWEAITTTGEYRVPYSVDSAFSPVDLGDVAQVAAAALLEYGSAGGIYPLAGPQRMRSATMAAEMAQVLGRDVHAVQQPLAEWIENAKKAGYSGYAIQALSAMFKYYDQHGFAGNSAVLEMLLGRPATKLNSFLSKANKEIS